jgi:DNA-binding NarL/FixJ family response regulator
VRVLLVEDEPLWQNAIRQLVAMQPGWQVVAVAVHYAEAVKYYDECNPDVVLLDWNLIGPKDGADVGNTLLAKGHPAENIVMISGADPAMLPDAPYVKVPKNRMAKDLSPVLANIQQACAR